MNERRITVLTLLSSALVLTSCASAQTLETLHSFVGSDGAIPSAGLVVSGNRLYGTTTYGGNGKGTVFALETDGTGMTNLHVFAGGDGAYPFATLILSGATLYGTTHGDGVSNAGTAYALNIDSTGFTNLHSFGTQGPGNTNEDGANIYGGLILSGDTLYGTAAGGGSGGKGTVFAIKTNGADFAVLHNFTGTSGALSTNNDGASPLAALILSGGTLYGTTGEGGAFGSGTIFALSTGDNGFKNLYSFTANPDAASTNSDGSYPQGALLLSGNTMYGTTFSGGLGARGTVFSVSTNGIGFTNLHNFTATHSPGYTNEDGSWPCDSLVLVGNTLYGTASGGGSAGVGTVFAVNTDGTGFTNLHSFTGGSDGAEPLGGLALSGSTLYGMAQYGGSNNGTVFGILFAPGLTITSSGPDVVVAWPTNVGGFDYTGCVLQCTSNLLPSAVWSAVDPAPTIVNGWNAVTNPISGNMQYYRLVR